MTRVAILDRDGTINHDVDFLTRVADLRLLPGAAQAVAELHALGFTVIICTNQSGIARGYLRERDLAAIHAHLHEALHGIPQAYLHCPHHPEALGPYAGACTCRKPGAGLLEQACELLSLSLAGAVVIGDAARDLQVAAHLPLLRIHVATGKPSYAEQHQLAASGVRVDYCADDLLAAARWLARVSSSVPGAPRAATDSK